MGVSKKELLEKIEHIIDSLDLEFEGPGWRYKHTNTVAKRLTYLGKMVISLAEAIGYEFKDLPAVGPKIVCQKKESK